MQRMSHLGKKLSKATSKYIAVHFSRKKYWQTSFTDKQKTIYIGSYKTELEAAVAYNKYVIEHNLDRPLNFSKD